VTIDDPLLPSAAHLTGPDAFDILRPAVAATGGELVACRTSHVQYRPESDLVVRYRCEIRRGAAQAVDTLLAATTRWGPLAGSLPVEATSPDGSTLSVGVWRWPFDPILVDLTTMVTPHLAAAHLHDLVGAPLHLDVVAYRPTERAVIRVCGPRREIYVKVVAPASVAAIVRRHVALSDAGIPVPRVLRSGSGWIAMEALNGTTLRDRLKQGTGALPSPERIRELLASLASVDLDDVVPVRSRLDDAPHHAAMLAAVMPGARCRLADMVERLSEQATPRLTATTHGDLHEAQLIVDDTAITGLVDIDDVGRGDPLDDVATLVGHLRFRAATTGLDRITSFAEHVRSVFARGHDERHLDLHIAGVLIGLATGPFRIQQPDWDVTTRRVLDLVEHHLDAAERAVAVRTP
jgi:aminoglycoside phosphotransferase